jgi:high-affinity nickel-transport protein
VNLNPFDDSSARVMAKLCLIYALLAVANIGAWGWALLAFEAHPVLLGTALLAYTLGLRHAFDADHITAIDNVVRKLVQDGKTPCSVGFFFSLGHCTIVLFSALAIVALQGTIQNRLESLQSLGCVAGTTISTAFLLVISVVNMFNLRSTCAAFLRSRHGETIAQADFELNLSAGMASRLLRPLMQFISSSWQMYALGFLFALGFDTATEIGVLGISATQRTQGLSLWSILVFPALFTAGMALMDTTDSVLMTRVYGWALLRGPRRLWYNLVITTISVALALFVASSEALFLLQSTFEYQGRFWTEVVNLNSNLTNLGCSVTILFLGSWAAAALLQSKPRSLGSELLVSRVFRGTSGDVAS